MAGTYRPTIIRYVNAQGQRVPKGTPGAKRVRVKSKTYWGRVAEENGKVRPVSLCDDADAAEAMLAEMKQRAKRVARGDIDPFEDHRQRPLAEHLADFERRVENGAYRNDASQFVGCDSRQTHGRDAAARGAIGIPAELAGSDLRT